MDLENLFMSVYTKFRINFYREIFNRFQSKEVGLTSMETLAVEMIHTLGEPTVNEFARFAKLSAPNAAYKIASLIQKGYLEKIQSKLDKREYFLRVTEKYKKHYNISYTYVSEIVKRAETQFEPQQIESLKNMLLALNKELSKDMQI